MALTTLIFSNKWLQEGEVGAEEAAIELAEALPLNVEPAEALPVDVAQAEALSVDVAQAENRETRSLQNILAIIAER